MNLDNIKQIARLDKEDMLDLIISFPNQCQDAIFISKKANIKSSYTREYANIIFTGLGGSAIGADIVKGYIQDEVNVSIFVNRDYTMPAFTGKNSLVFVISYSGNTEETLSAYSDATKRGANIVVITSGGKLEKLAGKNNNAIILIPKGYPPRCALGYSFIPAVFVLSKLGIIKNKINEIQKATDLLNGMQNKELGPQVKSRLNISKTIAKRLQGKFPVIYASDRLSSIATRWRGQFAENSKTLASMHVFSEMNHNEIVGWDHPGQLLKNFVAIVLRSKDDHPRIKIRMDITKAILKKNGFNIMEVDARGACLLERMLSLVYIGDFTSFYLSILNKIDPTPVDRIMYLKKQLAKK